MSISQPHYYEAKVFLKALIDAHSTLQEVAQQQAQIDKLKYYESTIVSAASKGYVKINQNSIKTGTGFDSTRIFKASNFVKDYFAKKLAQFDKVSNTAELVTALQNSIK